MMKHLFLSAFVLSCLTVSALADENIRAVQTKLKDTGFFFGEVNGTPSSDLSAAITRYQIRSGLQITGSLNAETSKSLGLKTEAAPASMPAAPNSETWRQLRKSDQQFHARAQASYTPAKSLASPAPEAARRALVPGSADKATLVLSPERLRDYVAAFVLAGVDPQTGAELEFFADRVRYYDKGMVGREIIRADLQRYNAQWPHRRFWLAGKVEVLPQPDSRLRVTFPLRYELQNGSKRSSGRIRKSLLLEVVGEDLQIVAVDERKAR